MKRQIKSQQKLHRYPKSDQHKHNKNSGDLYANPGTFDNYIKRKIKF